ncbi:hypothetical protein BASA60_011589 [Batrachochytrium salamandrivorans]|nr:hypothetical protein BASA60_011589 [Batrachochytrium salamandrivorans]
MRHPSAVWSFDFNSGSPDIVVCGRADGHITVWNAQSALRIDNIMPDPEWMHGTMESSLLAWLDSEKNHSGAINITKITISNVLVLNDSVNLSNFGLGLGFRIYPVLHVLVSKLRSIWFDIHQILLHPSLIPMSFLAWNRQTPWWKNSSLARHLSISYRTPAEQDLAVEEIQNRQPTRLAGSSWLPCSNIRKRSILSILVVIGLDHKIVIAANRIFLHQTNSSSSHTVLSWYLQNIDKSVTQIHRITLENDNCSVRWIQCIMIALSRSSTKLTVRNDVMDFLLTLFLPTCSVSEVLGINDAVQNVFTFFQAFKTRLQGTPSALELGCTNPDRFSVSCAF